MLALASWREHWGGAFWDYLHLEGAKESNDAFEVSDAAVVSEAAETERAENCLFPGSCWGILYPAKTEASVGVQSR